MAITTLFLRDLRVRSTIGHHAHERVQAQELLVQVVLHLKSCPARYTDHLEDTVDYELLSAHLAQVAQNSCCHLIEKLAQDLAEACLRFDSRIQEVELGLEKIGCLNNARLAGVHIKLA